MTSPWIELAGRLHPAFLHLPIGLWVGIGALEYGALLLRRDVARGAVTTLAWLSASCGIAAGVSGWILGGSGEYAGDLVESHKWYGIATTVLLEAMLSFLGRGVQPPTPAWGMMIFESQSYFLNAPWLVFIPGAAILILALAFNLVGDGLRDALDPTQRGRS